LTRRTLPSQWNVGQGGFVDSKKDRLMVRQPHRKVDSRLIRSIVLQLVVVLMCLATASAFAETILLKNGMQLSGSLGQLENLKTGALGAFGGKEGGTNIKSIVLVDDGLRRTLVPALQVNGVPDVSKAREVRILVPQQVYNGKDKMAKVGDVLKVTEFDEFGRRVFTMASDDGPRHVIQGITEVTPLYVRLQGLNSSKPVEWDMRLATSSISQKMLSRILRRLNPKNTAHRLQIVALYVEADRIQDARVELEDLVKDFPEMEGLNEQVDTLRQIGAQRLIREIKLRREAGQHRTAFAIAEEFPVEGVSGATVLSIREFITEYEELKKKYDDSLAGIAAELDKIEDDAVKKRLQPYCEEIARDLNVNTLSRLDDFNRLADDAKLTADQKVALALSGWILGSGAGTENTAVAMSLGQVRDLVQEYLSSKRKGDRSAILERLKGLEGSSPAYLAKIVANMKPPLSPPQPEKDEPITAGPLEIKVPGVGDDAEFKYLIQLPPEYDPYRRYPCILTLNAAGTTAAQQIDWWAGAASEKTGQRSGQATRQGYIVIAPKWTKDHQQAYEFSTREHAAVLFCLRDAMQKFAIDSDQVFLSGHSLGGDAAWDIACSHPDLWAGVIPIGANVDKYPKIYDKNARYVPWFFVVGEKDSKRGTEMLNQWDDYMKRAGYDVMISEYLGRGHEHFYDEIQRLFEWMRLHRRNFFPEKGFEVVSLRESDNFFWCLEFHDMPTKCVLTPLNWNSHAKINPMDITVVRTANNGLNVKCGAGGGTVYLSPEMLALDKKMPLSLPRKPSAKGKGFEPSAEVLLEDVRTRGDRLHPFWAKIDY
jgi:predicted esterase